MVFYFVINLSQLNDPNILQERSKSFVCFLHHNIPIFSRRLPNKLLSVNGERKFLGCDLWEKQSDTSVNCTNSFRISVNVMSESRERKNMRNSMIHIAFKMLFLYVEFCSAASFLNGSIRHLRFLLLEFKSSTYEPLHCETIMIFPLAKIIIKISGFIHISAY